MNAKLDKMTKSAKSQRRRLSAANEADTIVGKIREERSQSKQEEVSVWGPYRDGPSRFRLKISEKGEVRNVCYKTREDAESVKANLLAEAEERQECTVGAGVAERLHTELVQSVNPRNKKPPSAATQRPHSP